MELGTFSSYTVVLVRSFYILRSRSNVVGGRGLTNLALILAFFNAPRIIPLILRLRIVEAYTIKTRRPTLNRKQEDLGTGFLA